jgi:hypothetical protein
MVRCPTRVRGHEAVRSPVTPATLWVRLHPGAVAAIAPDLPLDGSVLEGTSGIPELSQRLWFKHPYAGPTPGALLVIHAIAHDTLVWTANTPKGDRRFTILWTDRSGRVQTWRLAGWQVGLVCRTYSSISPVPMVSSKSSVSTATQMACRPPPRHTDLDDQRQRGVFADQWPAMLTLPL